jgi:hypothetical protein
VVKMPFVSCESIVINGMSSGGSELSASPHELN